MAQATGEELNKLFSNTFDKVVADKVRTDDPLTAALRAVYEKGMVDATAAKQG